MDAGPKTKSARDSIRAAQMKKDGVCRTTQRCPQCYHVISCESWKSRYTHVCRG